MRAKRATYKFWMDKSSLKMPKMVNFDEFLKTWNLLSNSVTRQVNFNWTKIDRSRGVLPKNLRGGRTLFVDERCEDTTLKPSMKDLLQRHFLLQNTIPDNFATFWP